ncbi:hypothetical protein [Phenylobacterium sp.]|uniref:hypothetical protein n=1 Tax=Phenylobacterium sp. TaxID=1871053 RepID=UPI0025EC1568|nr:hypothetical protein [Phenylobacterium sp.]MBX3483517.1 hypothetical protein [Phenylobacterium sp.]
MEPDRSLMGRGPYPSTGPLAVLARAGFLIAVLAIVLAVVLPPRFVPDFVHSLYLQHFAAFYVVSLLHLAASPRTRISAIALRVVAFATVMESFHLLTGARVRPLIDNWAADVGGLAAALAPIAVARFRRRFERPTEGV